MPRQYVKRIWRVPKDRGPAAYLAALVVKAMVKHGWPAKAVIWPQGDGFHVQHVFHGAALPDDFQQALSIACRIMARTYRVSITEHEGGVSFDRSYVVTSGGFFKEQCSILGQ